MTKSFFSALRLAAIAVLCASSACQAQPAAPRSAPQSVVARAKGIYVVIGPRLDTNHPEAAFNGTATGVYYRTLWSTIQPSPNRYDWTALDATLAAAKRAGKRVSLGIRAGEATPDWLLDRTKTAAFTVGLRHGMKGNCEQIRIALPWDRQYLDAYGRMMTDLSRHLRATGSYDDVAIVKITGLNARTEEMHLPADKPAERQIAAGRACRISDAPAIWRQVGYRPALVFDAWKALAKSVGDAFPDKLLALPILISGDFPRVDANGNPVGRNDPDWVDVKRQVIQAGVQMFPGRFAVERTGLNNRGMSSIIADAKQMGALFGMQSNHRRGVGGGAGCDLVRGQEARACTPEDFRTTLAMGQRAGATFLEIWPVDAGRFGAQVSESARALQ